MDALVKCLPPLKLSHVSKSCIKHLLNQILLSHHAWESSVHPTQNIKLPPDQNLRHITGEVGATLRNNKKETMTQKTDMNIHGKTFTVYITQYGRDSCSNIYAHLRNIAIWLKTVIPFSDPKCSEHIDIYIFMTPQRRVMPHPNIELHPDYVFSAFTHTCIPRNQIYVYRQDDWFKAFVHETFHSFGLDFSNLTQQNEDVSKQLLSNVFHGVNPTHSNIRLYETYTDIWATIAATIVQISLFQTNKRLNSRTSTRKNNSHVGRMSGENINKFMPIIEREINRHRAFMIFQCVKMLNHGHQKVDFAELLHAPGKYKERVFLLSYHVMRPCIMLNVNSFLEWCMTHNGGDKYLQFGREKELNSYVDFAIECVKTPKFQEVYDCMKIQYDTLMGKKDKNAEEMFLWKTSRLSNKIEGSNKVDEYI